MNDDLDRISARADSLVESHQNYLDSLIRLRKKHSLTQEEVAERMGVSQPTVAAFERYDANPTLSSIRRYALAVGARLEHAVVDDCVPALTETGGAQWRGPVEGNWIHTGIRWPSLAVSGGSHYE